MDALDGMLHGIQSVILSLFHNFPITLTLETEAPFYQIALYYTNSISIPLYTAIEERWLNQLKGTKLSHCQC
jgi:hypothetical protein